MAVANPAIFEPMPTTPTKARRQGHRLVVVEAVEVLAIVGLVAASAFFGVQLNKSNGSLRAAQAKLTSTTASLKTTQANLAGAKSVILDDQQVQAYAGAAVAGLMGVDQVAMDADTACTGNDVAKCKAAIGAWSAKIAAVRSSLKARAVPPELATADGYIIQGLDMLASSAAQGIKAMDTHSQSAGDAATALNNQGWRYIDQGRDALLQALSAAQSNA